MKDRRLGLVINPIAGMGGRVAMHGTDGNALTAARARGGRPVTGPRAARALARLRARAGAVQVLTAGGAMGADVLDDVDLPYEVIHQPGEETSASDTRAAVAAIAERSVDLLLVVGGDGTLRDAAAALDSRPVPSLGVPAGVKMFSSAFAISPEAAADVASRYLHDPQAVGLRTAEVVDHAEHGPQLFATLQIPAVGGSVQAAKSVVRHGGDAIELSGLGREIAREMQQGRLYLLGPGTTVGYVAEAVGVPHSRYGVDALLDGSLVGSDLQESELLDLIEANPVCTLVLGVVGGQGFLLGRGNQQLSPAVLRAVGADNVVVLAARSKIAALQPPVLHVDVGESASQQPLRGYQRVRTASGHSTVLRIVS